MDKRRIPRTTRSSPNLENPLQNALRVRRARGGTVVGVARTTMGNKMLTAVGCITLFQL